jgi:energy-coupling factor transport system permease protein
MSSASFGGYVRRNTWVYGLDPRVKLAFVAVTTGLLLLWPSVLLAWAAAAACLALLVMARVPRARIVSFVRGMGVLLLLVFVLTTLFSGGAGAPLWRVGPLSVTWEGIHQAALLASRLLAVSLAFFFWLSTTDQGEMVRGFVALGLPYEWGLTIVLALRYLPILAGLFDQVREAQAARGLDLSQRRFVDRLASYRPVLIALVIGALRHGEHLGWALESRGLGGGVARTTFRPLRLHRIDRWALLLLGLITAAAILLRAL